MNCMLILKLLTSSVLAFMQMYCQPALAVQYDCRSVFAALPELTALLPPEASPQARPFSLGGIEGQQARGTVYIEGITLPQTEDSVQSRPKSAMYYATYRY